MKVAIDTTHGDQPGIVVAGGGAASHPSRRARCRRSSHLHGRHDRHARAELDVRRPVEHDLDRHALHDLHVIAGGVLRRQQAEGRAAAGLDAVDVAVKLRPG